MARKPRIVITVVTKDSTMVTSIVAGREMGNGGISPGPTERQFAIAHMACADLLGDVMKDVEAEAEANDAPPVGFSAALGLKVKTHDGVTPNDKVVANRRRS